MNPKNNHLSIYQIAVTALVTAFMCILGPISLPLGIIPLSFTNFIIFLALYLLGTKLCLFSYFTYLFLGMAGLPVFSGFSGGLSKLAGPTGGYLIGFIFMILLSGCILKKSSYKSLTSFLGMLLGTIVSYLFGTIWFMAETQCSFWYAATICVLPFVPGDLLKIFFTVKIGTLLRNTLTKAHLIEKL